MRWKWLSSAAATALARAQHPTLEQLRIGHNLLSHEQFCEELKKGYIEVLALPHDGAVLVNWGESRFGKVFNILTVCGLIENFEESYDAVEDAAREAGAAVIMSVGRAAYKKLMQVRGYEVDPCIFMKKVLR